MAAKKAGQRSLDSYQKGAKRVRAKDTRPSRARTKRGEYVGEGHKRTATRSGKTVGGITHVGGYTRRAWGTADDYSGAYRKGGYRRYPKKRR